MLHSIAATPVLLIAVSLHRGGACLTAMTIRSLVRDLPPAWLPSSSSMWRRHPRRSRSPAIQVRPRSHEIQHRPCRPHFLSTTTPMPHRATGRQIPSLHSTRLEACCFRISPHRAGAIPVPCRFSPTENIARVEWLPSSHEPCRHLVCWIALVQAAAGDCIRWRLECPEHSVRSTKAPVLEERRRD